MITTGQARRIACQYKDEGLHRLARTGVVSIHERAIVADMKRYEVRGSYRDPQGVMADARALAEWMDANVGITQEWAGEWDSTVVSWSYGR